MFNKEERKINVTADFASFRDSGHKRRITPLRFTLTSGESYHIADIRRSYSDTVGQSLQVHFVVETTDERFFDILFDSKKMMWFLILEIEDKLLLR